MSLGKPGSRGDLGWSLILGVVGGILLLASIWLPWVILLPGVALAGLLGLWGVASRRVAFFLLLVSVVIQHWTLPILGGNFRMEHAALGVILLSMTLGVVLGGRPRLYFHQSTATLAMLLIGLNALSSVLYAVEPVASLKIVLWLVLSFLIFLSVQQLVPWVVSLQEAMDWFLGVGAAVGAFGLVIFSLHQIGLPVPLIQIDPITNHATTYATMWEANIFGSFEMVVFSLALSQVLAAFGSGRRADWRLWALVIALLSLLISFTRAAWLGALLAVVYQVFRARHDLRLDARTLKLMAAGAAAIGLLFMIGAGSTLMSRALSVGELNAGSFAFRLIRYQHAIEGFVSSPLLGLGTNSFGQRFIDLSQGPDARDYLPSLFLQALYDTGILGFAVMIGFFAALFRGLRQIRRRAVTVEGRCWAAGCTATLAAILVAYQTTSAYWFGFSWVFFGLVVVLAEHGVAPGEAVSE